VRVAHEPGRLIVLFDAECGFCTRTARALRRLDSANRLALVPLQSAAAAVPDSPNEAALLDRMHVRDAAGRWWFGSEAWLRIAEVVPALRPAAVFARLPVIREFVEPVYRLVADNRRRISRLLGDRACRIGS
jgi:predicted DCC family thiol-disulfide oxidoreductase YuxK